MIELPERFKERMRAQLGAEYDRFISSYDRQPYRSVRVNTLKITAEEFEKISPLKLCGKVPWENNAFYVGAERAGKTVEHAAGLYYVQEPSATAAAPLLDVKPGERVLDMCSAPGGKGTRLAEAMRGEGVIMLNDPVVARAKILSQNVERLGITNAAVTSASPEDIAERFVGYFDKVLVDAPCSGEGMFLKEDAAIAEWSEENVLACARRQRKILESAQRTLKPDGLMVYSTCTFAPEEDERLIEEFLKNHPEFTLISERKLYPHECMGEGHYVALLKKLDGDETGVSPFVPRVDRRTAEEWKRFSAALPENSADGELHLAGNVLCRIMKDCPSLPFFTLRAGLRLCEVKGERLEPCHALAMSYPRMTDGFELDGQEAVEFLKGNALRFGEERKTSVGWRVATYRGFPIGWVKINSDIAKNHLPKGLRI